MRSKADALPNPVDVFVVGGGPAGLAAAIAAHRRGLSVAVADAAKPPIDKSCGEGLLPDGIEALIQLGLPISDFQSQAFAFRGIRFVRQAQVAQAEFPRGKAFGVRRTVLHSILVDHAERNDIPLLWGRHVTAIQPGKVYVDDEIIHARYVIGADGSNSRVRRWSKLDQGPPASVRFGFRRHYAIQPWTDFMELYWGDSCQIYSTPVSSAEVCLALVSNDPKQRIDDVLPQFPSLHKRLRHVRYSSTERGGLTVNRRLSKVSRDHVALIGDASGGVDAITGEGLCVAFRQASLLADCLSEGNLERYEVEHRRTLRRPAFMAQLMLRMGRQPGLLARAMRVFQAHPYTFARMLAMHIGEASPREFVTNGLAISWQLLTV